MRGCKASLRMSKWVTVSNFGAFKILLQNFLGLSISDFSQIILFEANLHFFFVFFFALIFFQDFVS